MLRGGCTKVGVRGFTPGGVQGQRPGRGSGGQRPPGGEFFNLEATKSILRTFICLNTQTWPLVHMPKHLIQWSIISSISPVGTKYYTCLVVWPLKKLKSYNLTVMLEFFNKSFTIFKLLKSSKILLSF